MLNYYQLTLAYQGANYLGWQLQPVDQGKTIQGELNSALEIISKRQLVKTTGSGRTDAGVNATAQVVKVTMDLEIDTNSLKSALNSLLPLDIRVISAKKCAESFHPIFDAIDKEYHYYFQVAENISPFLKDRITLFRANQFSLEKMVQGCQLFIGE